MLLACYLRLCQPCEKPAWTCTDYQAEPARVNHLCVFEVLLRRAAYVKRISLSARGRDAYAASRLSSQQSLILLQREYVEQAESYALSSVFAYSSQSIL